MKKVIAYVIAVLCTICLLSWPAVHADAKSSMTTKKLSLDRDSFEKFDIDVTYCNLKILETSGSDVLCEYDNDYFKVTLNQHDSNVSIDIHGKSEKSIQNENNTFGVVENKIVKLYLPNDLKADKVKISLSRGAADVKQVPQGNFQFDGDDCCMYYQEPDDNTNKVTINGTDCNGTIVLREDVEAEDVSVNASDCHLSCPAKFEKSKSKNKVRVYMELDECNFTVTTEQDRKGYGACIYVECT